MFLVDTNDQLTVGFVRVDRNITAQSYHIDLMGVNVDVTAGGNALYITGKDHILYLYIHSIFIFCVNLKIID